MIFMYRFTIEIAHKTLGIESSYVYTKNLCGPFITADGDDNLTKIFRVTDEELESACAQVPDCTPDYLESVCLHKQIVEWLPIQGCFVFHGAAISFNKGGYIFSAPSGTGKSTHIRLWRKFLGEAVDIVNGDKPVISVQEGEPLVCGTPWAGKEDWKRNICVPVRALCFLDRSTENSVVKLSSRESLGRLFNQTYLSENEGTMKLTLEHVNRLLEKVPVYLLRCDMSEEAVRCSFEGLTGLSYDTYRK